MLQHVFQFIPAETIRALCWTLIHSLWQGLIAAIVAGAILMLTRHSRSQFRYKLLSGVFMLLIIAVICTFYILYASPQRDLPNSFQNSSAGNSFLFQNTEATGSVPADRFSFLENVIIFFNNNSAIIVLTWFVFLVARSIKFVRGIYQIHKIKTRQVLLPPAHWVKRVEELKEQLKITKQVRFLESALVSIPSTIGYFKPFIFIPVGLVTHLPSEQVESILMHELAHIRRNDYVVNFFQRLAELVFFFNPGILWISMLLREEAETCCDDIVIANTSDKSSYVDALISFQEFNMGMSGYAVGLTTRRNFLIDRVKRLVYNENKKLNIFEQIFLALGLFAITAFGLIKNTGGNLQTSKSTEQLSVQYPNSYKSTYQNFNSINVDTLPDRKQNNSSQLKRDTTFESIAYHKSNDPQALIYTYDIKDNLSNTYTITRKSGQMVALVVNGKQIAAEQLSEYHNLFNKAESFISRATLNKNKLRLAAIDNDNRKTQVSNSSLEKGQVVALEPGKTQLVEDEVLHKKYSLPQQENKKLESVSNEGWKKDAQRIKDLLQDLVNEGVVNAGSGVEWFGINENKMMVNGKELSAALHNKFKTKYGIDKDYGLFYGQGTMHGTGIYFDKTEL